MNTKFQLKFGKELSFRIAKIYDRPQLDWGYFKSKTGLIQGWMLYLEISYYKISLIKAYKVENKN